MSEIIPVEVIAKKIFIIRGQKVMLDFHIAELYGVETKALKRAVKRNILRFPGDFMFELIHEEYASLRRHFGALEKGKHAKYLPYAFTEHGVAMLSSVLRSKRAIEINIMIIRTFIELGKYLATHQEVKTTLQEHHRILYIAS